MFREISGVGKERTALVSGKGSGLTFRGREGGRKLTQADRLNDVLNNCLRLIKDNRIPQSQDI